MTQSQIRQIFIQWGTVAIFQTKILLPMRKAARAKNLPINEHVYALLQLMTKLFPMEPQNKRGVLFCLFLRAVRSSSIYSVIGWSGESYYRIDCSFFVTSSSCSSVISSPDFYQDSVFSISLINIQMLFKYFNKLISKHTCFIIQFLPSISQRQTKILLFFIKLQIIIRINLEMDSEIILGYWNIRGLAQVPRLLLTYTKANWKDKLYNDRESWFNNDKKNMSLAFPNLPYLLDGDLRITESSAINRYIINRSEHKKLLGKDMKDQAVVDNLLGVISDLRAVWVPLFFSQNYATEIKEVPAKIEKKLQCCQNCYGDKQFALGYLTLPDFIFAENAYYLRDISEQLYKKFSFLERVRLAVENLPETQAYYARQGAIKLPFMPQNSNMNPKLS